MGGKVHGYYKGELEGVVTVHASPPADVRVPTS